MFSELLDLLESGVAEKKDVSEIIGYNAAKFCDELILASNTNRTTKRAKLNQDIEDYFSQKGEDNVAFYQKNQRR